MNADHEIFFSYAWDDGQDQNRPIEKIVLELYESLLKDNYRVVLDKYDCRYKGFISDFMTSIGKSRCIIIAISHKYVRSPYCMFELYEIARNSNFDKGLFRKKVIPVIVDFIDFAKPSVITEHLSFWNKEYKEWDDLVKNHSGQLSVEQLQRYDKIKMVHQNFSKLADWIIDMNALTPQVLSAHNFAEIKKAIVDSLNQGPEIQLEKETKQTQDGVKRSVRRRLVKPLIWLISFFVAVVIIAFFSKPPAQGRKSPLSSVDTPAKAIEITNRKDTTHNQSKKTANTKLKEKATVPGKEKSERVDSIAIPMCKASCNTNDIPGVEIFFIDTESQPNREYSYISAGNNLTFDVPCYLTDQTIKVRFTKNGQSEERNVSLKDFEIPEFFKPK